MFFKSKKSAFDYLVVGLGNPGMEYEKTRHNAGFMAIDRLASDIGAQFNKNKHKALFGEGNINGKRVLLAKPMIFPLMLVKSVSAVKGARGDTTVLRILSRSSAPRKL